MLKGIDQYITHSTRTHHPKFMQKFGLGLNQAAFAGEAFAGLTQAPMYTYECAPIATLIELECIKKMCNMVGPGFDEASGVFTTGSSMGNMYGLLCAR